MAIDYTGYASLFVDSAQVRLSHIQKTLKPDVSDALLIAPAKDLGPFDKEIAHGFGFVAASKFSLFVQNKDRLDLVPPVLEFIYQVFGTEKVLMLWGNDMAKPATRPYPGYDLDAKGTQ